MTLQTFFPGLEPAEPPAVERPTPAAPAPKKGLVPQRDMTADEREAVRCLSQQVTYTPGSWDKRFARELGTVATITAKESAQVWRLFHRYRRQIRHADKTRLLEVAATLAAPDLRKQAAADEMRRRIEATKHA